MNILKKICTIAAIMFSSFSNTVTQPKISIITSVFNGDQFIEHFLAEITKQTIFDQCELIMINANSPGSEEAVIIKYMQQYPNIVYESLAEDPGLYGVWNKAIEMSNGEYITNANLDDRLAYNCYEVHAQELDRNPEIMLVYSDYIVTETPNKSFSHSQSGAIVKVPEFSIANMMYCLPGCNPMWRKSLHTKYGLFNAIYKSAGDYEMWLRAVEGGAPFKKINGCYALCYLNPQGLSTGPHSLNHRELKTIIDQYGHLWKHKNFDDLLALAKSLDRFGNNDQSVWPHALYYYLKAFSTDYRRAEPLVHIAQHYYERGDFPLAYLFAKRACEMPMPETAISDADLHRIYTYQRYDILGIVAWYVGEYEVGEKAIKAALGYHPNDEHLESNLGFYTQRKSEW